MNNVYVKIRPSTVCPNEILRLVLDSEEQFTPSKLYGGYKKEELLNNHHRHSLSWRHPLINEIGAKISNEICARKDIFSTLGISDFSIGNTETSCVAFGDGCFFKEHTDFIPNKNIQRRLTWVYYLHCEPKAFEGGELVFRENGQEVTVATPEHGMLIIFNPKAKHQVLPVILKENVFKNYRITITGFVCNQSTLLGILKQLIFFHIYKPIASIKYVKRIRRFWK